MGEILISGVIVGCHLIEGGAILFAQMDLSLKVVRDLFLPGTNL